MSIKQRLEQDLKSALLSGDKHLATTLRGLKSAILYVEVAEGSRDTGLADDEVMKLFLKEAKKRQESADLYLQGGNKERADLELQEKTIIEQYLPKQLSEAELLDVVKRVISENNLTDNKSMGIIIGKVKAITGSTVDGGRIASAVKKQME